MGVLHTAVVVHDVAASEPDRRRRRERFRPADLAEVVRVRIVRDGGVAALEAGHTDLLPCDAAAWVSARVDFLAALRRPLNAKRLRAHVRQAPHLKYSEQQERQQENTYLV